MKHGLDGPWLTLHEVRQKTGCVKNETLFCIQEGGVIPVIYTDNRPFLAITCASDGVITGHATFRYSGPVAVDQTVIDEIVRLNKSMVGQRIVRLLRPGNITDWRACYPFHSSLPNGVLSYWEPVPVSSAATHYSAIHLPQEHPDYECAESAFVEQVPDYYDEDEYFNRYAGQYLVRSPQADYVYGTDYNSVYNQDDLRLPLAALNYLTLPVNNKNIPRTVSDVDKPSIPPLPRTKELHTVIDRVVAQYPQARSSALWNTLRSDCLSTPRHFDTDEIITAVDNTCIHWVSTNGVQQVLKKTSFQTLVSRLRKQNREKTLAKL